MDDAVRQNVLEKIRTRVRDHYSKTDVPYLLSTLGQELRKEGIWPEDAPENLRSFIERAADPELQVVRNPSLAAKIAITDSAHRAAVQMAVNGASGHRVGLGNLPRSIVLAFCTKISPGQSIYVKKERPNNFQSQPPDPSDLDQYWVIPAHLRVENIDFVSFSQLSPERRSLLQTNMQTWMADQGFSESSFLPARRHVPSNTALERLVAAQQDHLRRLLVIPADIALLLSKRE